jgi:hypothetical protein
MGAIMCAQPLWRAVRPPGRSRKALEQPVFQGVAFARWAATVARFDGEDLVIGLEAGTYLTIVFRLNPLEHFRRSFADALRAALADLGAPERTGILESMVVETLPFVRLTDQRLASRLKDLRFFCDLELDYHDDLRLRSCRRRRSSSCSTRLACRARSRIDLRPSR